MDSDSILKELIFWLLGLLQLLIIGTVGWMRTRIVSHAERIAKVEQKALTEHEVRSIVQDEIEPIKATLTEIKMTSKSSEEILTELRVSTAVLASKLNEQASKED